MPEQGKNKGLLSRKDQKNTQKKGKSYLLGIGINQYEAFPNLNNAVKDVKDIKKLLVEKYDVEEQCVTLLFNEKASRAHIIAAFDSLTEH